VTVTKADGTPYLFKSLGGLALTSLLPSGQQTPQQGVANPAALNIEFDISIINLADPANDSAWLRIWGLGLQDIGTASNLNGLNIAIYAGMSKGLPLANPSQAGLIMQGKILYAFGNWVGTSQTVEMNFQPGQTLGSATNPQNFPFSWPAGVPLATAIAQTLAIAMPGVTQNINISPRLALNYAITGWYQSAQQFADFINEISSTIIGGTYNGVSITTNGQTVNVFDGTVAAPSVKAIAFPDLIGQPTWSGPATISVKTVLRADIHVGDTVSLPPSLVTVTAQGASFLALADKTAFSGKYYVAQAEHFGNFRQSDAESWATAYQMNPIPQDQTPIGSTTTST
jgi:hypothetical protein